MSDVSLKLSAKDIYEKDFEKTMVRGYRPEEVDAFLDDIIADYQKMADLNSEVIKLSEQNNKLKKKLKIYGFVWHLVVHMITKALQVKVQTKTVT